MNGTTISGATFMRRYFKIASIFAFTSMLAAFTLVILDQSWTYAKLDGAGDARVEDPLWPRLPPQKPKPPSASRR